MPITVIAIFARKIAKDGLKTLNLQQWLNNQISFQNQKNKLYLGCPYSYSLEEKNQLKFLISITNYQASIINISSGISLYKYWKFPSCHLFVVFYFSNGISPYQFIILRLTYCCDLFFFLKAWYFSFNILTQTLELVNLDEDLNKADDIAQKPPKKKKGKPLKCGPIWKGKKR